MRAEPSAPRWRSSSRCTIGSTNAAVLPVPVSAQATRSRPAATVSNTALWIGVVCSKRRSSTPMSSSGTLMRSVNRRGSMSGVSASNFASSSAFRAVRCGTHRGTTRTGPATAAGPARLRSGRGLTRRRPRGRPGHRRRGHRRQAHRQPPCSHRRSPPSPSRRDSASSSYKRLTGRWFEWTPRLVVGLLADRALDRATRTGAKPRDQSGACHRRPARKATGDGEDLRVGGRRSHHRTGGRQNIHQGAEPHRRIHRRRSHPVADRQAGPHERALR